MKKLLSIYWRYSKGIRKYAYGTIIFLMFGFVLQDILRPYVFKRIIDGISLKNGESYIWQMVFVFLAVQILGVVFFRIGEFLNIVFEAHHMKILRNAVLKCTLKHSLNFFTSTSTGALVTKQKRFVASAELLFDLFIDQYMYVAIQIIGVITVMSFISVPIAFGILVWTLLYFGYIMLVLNKRIKLDTVAAHLESKVTSVFADIMGTMSVVKMFGASRREEERFGNVTNNHYKALLNSWKFSNTQNLIQGIFSTLLHIGAIAGGVYLWTKEMFTPGELVLIAMYAGQLSGCLWGFGRSIKRCTQAVADAKEMVEIMEKTPDIQDAPNAIDTPYLKPEQSSITFHNVSFAYEKGTNVFTDFSLHIPAGQKVAVIGSSGAGKTTLVQMLLRNADVQSGAITIGHYNIAKDVTQDGLKSLISCVSQNIDMFNRNIRENVAYGKENVSEDEIINAAQRARIHSFIETLTKKYDTRVGERGVKLSGGQRQRVAIARALVHNAPILILDEATSSLDNVTEKEIQNILENGLKEKTVIVIAHRLSTIRNCDRILVLENGQIVQDGNHDSLITDKTGSYYRMLNSHEFAMELKEGKLEKMDVDRVMTFIKTLDPKIEN